MYSYRFLYIGHLLKARQTNNAFDRVFVNTHWNPGHNARPPWKDLPKLWIQELRQNRLRNAIMCCEFVCRDSTDDSYWISAKFYGIVSLHKYIALKNYVKRQLFVTVVIKWKNGVMYSPVTYISGFRFNSYTKYFYLSTISNPRSEKSNREGMYWIRMRHGYCLDTQTRIKAHQNAI